MAKIVAISPSALTVAGGTVATPGVSATACWSAPSSVSAAPFAVSTASRNGPLEPGPNAG
jgi:hypothetical protein